jgi:hypothetical protein
MILFSDCYEIVPLQKNSVDRLESYDLKSAKSCAFKAHQNVLSILHLFPTLFAILSSMHDAIVALQAFLFFSLLHNELVFCMSLLPAIYL